MSQTEQRQQKHRGIELTYIVELAEKPLLDLGGKGGEKGVKGDSKPVQFSEQNNGDTINITAAVKC